MLLRIAGQAPRAKSRVEDQRLRGSSWLTLPGMGLFIHSKRDYVVASASLSEEGGGRTFNDCGGQCEEDSGRAVVCEAA